MTRRRKPIAERFWAKVAKTSGCWLWTGARLDNGYGVIGRGGRGNGNMTAHRAAWVVVHGAIPDGLHVCHRCDNRRCVNPGHLFVGTRSDNMSDCAIKGRAKRKLEPDDVRSIRLRLPACGGYVLAREYGVTPQAIYALAARRTWRHLA